MIAGSRRGRRLVVPTGDGVRPTKDIVREAMFSALESRAMIVDGVVLDLFAGARRAGDRVAVTRRGPGRVRRTRPGRRSTAISRNLDHDGPGGPCTGRTVERRRASSPARLPTRPRSTWCSPTRRTTTSDDTVAALVGSLAASGWLAAGALIAVERPARAQTRPPDGFQACWERTFGDTLVVFVDAFDPSS